MQVRRFLQDDRKGRQKFTIGRVLLSFIQLFPQGQRVILVLVDVKGSPQDPM